MSQSGYTPILIYASGTATNVPLAANLTSSASGAELALNYADGKLYYKNSSGTVTLLASAAGSLGDVVGPASATDNALARFDLTTGKLIQNSVGILSDTGALSGITDIAASGSITLSGGTANGVAYLNGSKVLTTGSALVFDGTNLGVGTASPSDMLDVSGNARVGQGQVVATSTVGTVGIYSGITSGSGNAQLKFFGKSVDNTGLTYELGRISGGSFGTYGIDGGLSFSTALNNGSNVLTLSERARINADGTLQVGRTGGSSADGKLQVGATGTGAGAANTKLGFALIEDDSGNAAGLWLGAMTNQNTGVIGSRTATGNIAFQTYNGGWGERARITYDGNLLVGATSTRASAKLDIRSDDSIAIGSNASFYGTIGYSAGTGYLSLASEAGGGAGIKCLNGTTTLSIIDLNSLYAYTGVNPSNSGTASARIFNSSAGASTTTLYIGNASITTVSDSRLKENIVDTQRNALELLGQLRVVDHTWNDPSDQCENNRNSRGTWMGLIAQEAQPIIPWLVNKPTADVDENGDPQYWHMDYGYSVPLLVKAIQEQQALITQLTARITALEGASA